MPGSPYSELEQKEAMALFVLASAKPKPYVRAIESYNEAAKEENRPPCKVPYGTVKRWAYTDKREMFQQVKSEMGSSIYAAMEDRTLGLARVGIELLGSVASELENRLSTDEIKALKTPELLKAWHELHVGMDISLGKAMAIGGKPTSIVRMDYGSIKEQLETRHGIKISLAGEETKALEESNAA
jgi:hypothetical protein